jgi:hypothetical protein
MGFVGRLGQIGCGYDQSFFRSHSPQIETFQSIKKLPAMLLRLFMLAFVVVTLQYDVVVHDIRQWKNRQFPIPHRWLLRWTKSWRKCATQETERGRKEAEKRPKRGRQVSLLKSTAWYENGTKMVRKWQTSWHDRKRYLETLSV